MNPTDKSCVGLEKAGSETAGGGVGKRWAVLDLSSLQP